MEHEPKTTYETAKKKAEEVLGRLPAEDAAAKAPERTDYIIPPARADVHETTATGEPSLELIDPAEEAPKQDDDDGPPPSFNRYPRNAWDDPKTWGGTPRD